MLQHTKISSVRAHNGQYVAPQDLKADTHTHHPIWLTRINPHTWWGRTDIKPVVQEHSSHTLC